MFFFGILSTHIPYLILTILYLLGIGAYSVNLYKSKAETDSLEFKTIHVGKDKPIEYSKKDFHYNDYNHNNVKQNSKTIISKNQSFYKTEIFLCYIIKPILRTCKATYHNSYFSRPPPASFF